MKEIIEGINATVLKIDRSDEVGRWNPKTLKWTGLIETVRQREVDIGFGSIRIDADRFDAIKFTYPTSYGDYSLHFKKLDVAQLAWSAHLKVVRNHSLCIYSILCTKGGIVHFWSGQGEHTIFFINLQSRARILLLEK